MGVFENTSMEAVWHDARITHIFDGTNKINHLIIVGILLRKTQKGTLDLITFIKFVANELISIPSFETSNQTEHFFEEKTLIKNLILLIAGKAIENFEEQLETHQQLLIKLVNIIIWIYLYESVLLRTEKHFAITIKKNKNASP